MFYNTHTSSNDHGSDGFSAETDIHSDQSSSKMLTNELSGDNEFLSPIPKKSRKSKASTSIKDVNKEAMDYFQTKRALMTEKKDDDPDLAFFTCLFTQHKANEC